MNRDNDMGRNAEHYADPTPAAAMKNIRKDERQKDAATMLQISILVPCCVRWPTLQDLRFWAESL